MPAVEACHALEARHRDVELAERDQDLRLTEPPSDEFWTAREDRADPPERFDVPTGGVELIDLVEVKGT